MHRGNDSALLIVDMQNDYCAQGGYMDRVMQRDVSKVARVAAPIARLADIARAAAVPLLWVRANYDPEKLSEPMLAKQRERGVEGEVLCAEGSWGAEFYKLAPQSGEPVITKHRFSAFYDTDIKRLLNESGVKTIIVVGISTNVCIDSTVRDGFMAGFHIIVAEDCVAAFSESQHRATLENIQSVFGTVCHSHVLIEEWNKQ